MLKRILTHPPISSSFRSQSGQIAVIVFLIMAVLLVIGLSLATRTSREIELAGQQEDTTRVFNAAESGVEQILSDDSNFTGSVITSSPPPFNGAQVTQTVTPKDELDQSTLKPGEVATVFVSNTSASNISIYWGEEDSTPGACDRQAAIIVSTYYADNTVKHYGYRPIACPTQTDLTGTNFDTSDSGTVTGYYNRKTHPVDANAEFVRIRPLFNETSLHVEGSILEAQQHEIRSEAVDTQGTQEVRTIQVTRQRPAPPGILDYALYSGGSLSK